MFAVGIFFFSSLVLSSSATMDDDPDSCSPLKGSLESCNAYIASLQAISTPGKEDRFRLAQSLSNLALMVDSEATRATILDRKNAVYRSLLADYPDDAEILAEYAYTHENDATTIQLLKSLLKLRPGDFRPHWIIGDIQVDQTDLAAIEDGLRHYRSAYELATGTSKINRGSELVHALERHGYKAEALDVRKDIRAAFNIDALVSAVERSLSEPPPDSGDIISLRSLHDTACHYKYLLFDPSACSTGLRAAKRMSATYPGDRAVSQALISFYESMTTANVLPDSVSVQDIREAYSRVLDDDPDNAETLRAFATHLEGEERIAILRRIVTGDSATAFDHEILAERYFEEGEIDDAIREMEAAIKRADPTYQSNYRARLAEMRGELEPQEEEKPGT